MAAAHKAGIVHRDIKPENVMLHQGEPMVTDFGIARALSGEGESLTQTGISLGTPAYMSPEQASGEHGIDGRSDIYSLACMLYEMLAGEPPFTGPTVHVYTGSVLPPLQAGSFNLVQRGRTVPVKITVGCNGFLGGLHPAISLRAGDYDPSVDPSDPSYVVPDSSSAADTSGVMRESDGQYIYNLAVPSSPVSGQLFTILVRPFGGSSPTLTAVLKIK